MSGRKRRKSVITDSDSENEQDNVEGKQRLLTPGTRSSERLNKKYSRKFQMPSREKVWDDIPSTVSTTKPQDTAGRRRKLANDFSRVTHRYNQDELDPCQTDSDDSLEDFLDDSFEELSEASIKSESDKACSNGRHDMDRRSSSVSDDDQIHAGGSTRKHIIASDSSSDTEPYNTSSNKCVAMRISSDDDEEENLQNVVIRKMKRTPKDSVLQSDSSESETSENIVHNPRVHTDSADKQDYSNKVENVYSRSSDSDDPGTSVRKRKHSKTSQLIESDDSDNTHVNGTLKVVGESESLQTREKEDFEEYNVNFIQKIDESSVNTQSDIQKSNTSRRHINNENTHAAGDLTVKSKADSYDDAKPTCHCDRATSNNKREHDESGYGNSSNSHSSTESSDDESSDTSSSEELERHAKHVKRQARQLSAKKQNFHAFLEARKKLTSTKK